MVHVGSACLFLFAVFFGEREREREREREQQQESIRYHTRQNENSPIVFRPLPNYP